MKLDELVKEFFSEGTSENETILEVYKFITSTPPTSKAVMLNRLLIADTLRPQIAAIIYQVREIHRVNELKYRVKYDHEFTVLTGIGRPSAQSIECEIYDTIPELRDAKQKLDKIDAFIYMLQSFVKSLDQVKNTADSYLKSYGLLDK